MPVLLAVVGLPLIEIALFIWVGSHIGVLATLTLVVASAFAGSFVLRREGMQAFYATRRELRDRKPPERDLFDRFCRVVAGLLLIIPGFLTDAIAIALLIPAVREAIYQRLAPVRTAPPPGVIDVDFRIVEEDRRPDGRRPDDRARPDQPHGPVDS